jgi:hypothetical protein
LNGRLLAAAAALALACAKAPARYDGPIIDNHAHLPPESDAQRADFIDELAAAMKRDGVIRTVIGLNATHLRHRALGPAFSPTHDEWVRAAFARHPGEVWPSLAGFDPRQAASVDYVRRQLETGFWKEIGELDLRNAGKEQAIPADSAAMMKIYALAGRRGVPVSIHYNYTYGVAAGTAERELERAVAANPGTIFITAHHANIPLMRRHENLWGEYQPHPWNPSLEDLLKEEPRLEDRLVSATDAQSVGLMHPFLPWGANAIHILLENPRAKIPTLSYHDRVELLRRDLGKIPREQAEKIAYKNLQRLLGAARPPR